MPKEIPALDAQTLALLKERRAMFSETASVLPSLHRRLRVAEMQKTSLRQALRHNLEEFWDRIATVTAPAGLGYAGAMAAVALALVFGLQQTRSGGERLLTLNPAPAAPAVQYAFNDVSSLPVTLDQRIDQMTSGQSPSASAQDVNQDSAQHAAGAHYVLTSAPASYDSVVAF